MENKKILQISDLSEDLEYTDSLKIKLSETDNLLTSEHGIKVSRDKLVEKIARDPQISRILMGDDVQVTYGKDIIIKDLKSRSLELQRNSNLEIPLESNNQQRESIGVFYLLYTKSSGEINSSNPLYCITYFKGRIKADIDSTFGSGCIINTAVVKNTNSDFYHIPIGFSEAHSSGGFTIRRFNDNYTAPIYIRGLQATVQWGF